MPGDRRDPPALLAQHVRFHTASQDNTQGSRYLVGDHSPAAQRRAPYRPGTTPDPPYDLGKLIWQEWGAPGGASHRFDARARPPAAVRYRVVLYFGADSLTTEALRQIPVTLYEDLDGVVNAAQQTPLALACRPKL
jgi:hypothetical protein